MYKMFKAKHMKQTYKFKEQQKHNSECKRDPVRASMFHFVIQQKT